MGWSLPVTQIDGVDEKGHVCYSQQIGEVELGEDLKLPLIINFRSDRESSSPYLGKGWILPLLESNFVQTGENSFLMTQPDGWVHPFYRGKSSETVLDGGRNWKAEIKGDTIIASAGCGWKLTFLKGKIVGMQTPSNRRLEFIESGGRIVEMRENGVARLSFEKAKVPGADDALIVNGKRIGLALNPRPHVSVVGGSSLIDGVYPSLSRVSRGDGFNQQFEFAVDDARNPTFNVLDSKATGRLFTWSPASKLITRDQDWRYKITPATDATANAAISRQNSSGEVEFWHKDFARGKETFQQRDGLLRVYTNFVSGPMAGELRRIDETLNGITRQTYAASYSEKGKLLRQVRRSQDSESEVRYQYDESGRVTKETHLAGEAIQKQVSFNYKKTGETEITINQGGRSFTRTYDKQGAFRESIGLAKE